MPGTILNGCYRIERVLGQGGFGITYLATDIGLDKQVAIKEFFPKVFCSRDPWNSSVKIMTPDNVTLVQKFKKKFLDEARTIAKLDHRNIIKIHACFEQNDTAYYVMEYIIGDSVSELVKRYGPIPADQAIKWTSEIGNALDYLHATHRRINHLDVKPANIMVRKSDNCPILIDFGLAKQYDDAGSHATTSLTGVSHGFAPIEQYRPGGVRDFSAQTDEYSLAATFYYMLSGVVPQSAQDTFEKGLLFPQSIPNNLIQPISRAMSSRINDRYPSVKEFIQAINGGNYGDKENKKRNNNNTLYVVIGIAVAVIIIIGCVFLTNKKTDNPIEKKYPVEQMDPAIRAQLEARYDTVGRLSENRVIIRENGKYGFVDKNGNVVIEPQFDDAWYFSEGRAAVKVGKKRGYIDEMGNMVIPPQFGWAGFFREGMSAVSDGHKNGFIDRSGRLVIGFQFDHVWPFEDGKAKVNIGSETFYIDKEGNYLGPATPKEK